jgi:hypothetical protein
MSPGTALSLRKPNANATAVFEDKLYSAFLERADEFLKNKARSPATHQVFTNLHAALLAFQRDTVGELASSA